MEIKQVEYFKHASGLEYHNYWIMYENGKPVLIEKHKETILSILGIPSVQFSKMPSTVTEINLSEYCA